VGCHQDQELEDASNIKFRQVRATEGVIPYVLCDGLYCLRCVSVLEGVLGRPYLVWGDRVTLKS
jgi:hypothetical protein